MIENWGGSSRSIFSCLETSMEGKYKREEGKQDLCISRQYIMDEGIKKPRNRREKGKKRPRAFTPSSNDKTKKEKRGEG